MMNATTSPTVPANYVLPYVYGIENNHNESNAFNMTGIVSHVTYLHLTKIY